MPRRFRRVFRPNAGAGAVDGPTLFAQNVRQAAPRRARRGSGVGLAQRWSDVGSAGPGEEVEILDRAVAHELEGGHGIREPFLRRHRWVDHELDGLR